MTVPLIESFPQVQYEESEAEDNMSTGTQFALLRCSDFPNLQGLSFGVFTIIHIIILIRNGLFIIMRLDPALHKPMYFFPGKFFLLGNLLRVRRSP